MKNDSYMNFNEMSLQDLQGLRDKVKGERRKAVVKAIDNLFLPPKPRKVKKKKERRSFSSR